MVQLLYNGIDGRSKILEYNGPFDQTEELYSIFADKEVIPIGSFKLFYNDKPILKCLENIKNCDHATLIPVTLHPLLVGGKGGFGSMLRAIGAQIEKTTNKEACRDLSGRRLRDINAEKRFKEWVSKQSKERDEKEKKRKEKLEKMKQEPKIMFEDPDYFKNKEEIPQEIDEALEYGLKNAKTEETNGKRKNDTKKDVSIKKQKKSMWMGVDLDDSDLDDSCDDDSDSDGMKKSNDEKELLATRNSEKSQNSPQPGTSTSFDTLTSELISDDHEPRIEISDKKICINPV